MELEQEYTQETGKLAWQQNDMRPQFYSYAYVEWLENKIEILLKSKCICKTPLIRTNPEGGEYCGNCQRDLD